MILPGGLMNITHPNRLRRTLVSAIILLSLTSLSETLCAQSSPKDKRELIGTWAGSMTTSYGQDPVVTRVAITFDDGSKVLVTEPVLPEGIYKLNGNEIVLDFQFKTIEPITLTNVRLSASSLEADAKFASDSGQVRNHLVLARQKPEPVVPAPPGPVGKMPWKTVPSSGVATAPSVCGGIPIAPFVKEWLNIYQMKCPINIVEHLSWYKFNFFTELLSTLTNNLTYDPWKPDVGVINTTPHPLRDPARIKGGRGGILILVRTVERRDQIRALLTPLVEDKEHLAIEAFEDYSLMQAGTHSFPASALKPSLRVNDSIEVEKVWAAIVNAALPLGINLDGKSETKKPGELTIKQTTPRRIPDPGGYIYFEYVSVTMRIDGRGTPDRLSVDVTSRIVKRKGFSSFVQKVDCDLYEARDRFGAGTICSEAPYLKAIIKSLTGEE